MRGRTWVRVLDAVLRAVTSSGARTGGETGSGSGPGGAGASAPARRTPTRRTRSTVSRDAAEGSPTSPRATGRPGPRSSGTPARGQAAPSGSAARDRARTAGDHTGVVRPQYSPDLDGRPDPGEIVWTWVPYEDDPARGKDRPVLLVGRDGEHLLGLMLTSKDHTRDAADEARWGRAWLDIGAGDWDAQRRPSEVRLDRVLRVDPDEVRREGAVMDRALFDRVTGSLVAHHGW